MYARLEKEKQVQVIHALAENMSIRGIERMTGVHRDTIMRLGLRIGNGCQGLLDQTMRNLPLKNIEVDEFWGFIFRKQGTPGYGEIDYAGDIWTWVALDTETKVVPSVWIGQRNRYDAKAFMDDLASRLTSRIQLSSDALDGYANAVEDAFGPDIDYGQVIKKFTPPPNYPPGTRGTTGKVVRVTRNPIQGAPSWASMSTSQIEKQNHTVRMHLRRVSRATNAFSKKLSNYRAAVYLHYAYYNFCKTHLTIRMPPAMAAGVSTSPWTVAELIEAVEKIHPPD